MNRIEIVPADIPADKEQKQKTLVLAVMKLTDEYLASEDDKIAVGLSLIGTAMANQPRPVRERLYLKIGVDLITAMGAIDAADRREGRS